MTRILGIAVLWLLSICGAVAISIWLMDTYIRPEFGQVQAALQTTVPAVSMQRDIGGGVLGQECSVQHTGCAGALLHVINADRAKAGAPALRLDWTLTRGTASCSGALAHARAMAQSGSLWHQNPAYPAESFPNDVCEQTMAMGQNAGLAYGDEWAAVMTDYGQMISEGVGGGHHDNLLGVGSIPSQFTRVGIGIYYTNQTMWLVETFAA